MLRFRIDALFEANFSKDRTTMRRLPSPPRRTQDSIFPTWPLRRNCPATPRIRCFAKHFPNIHSIRFLYMYFSLFAPNISDSTIHDKVRRVIRAVTRSFGRTNVKRDSPPPPPPRSRSRYSYARRDRINAIINDVMTLISTHARTFVDRRPGNGAVINAGC